MSVQNPDYGRKREHSFVTPVRRRPHVDKWELLRTARPITVKKDADGRVYAYDSSGIYRPVDVLIN